MDIHPAVCDTVESRFPLNSFLKLSYTVLVTLIKELDKCIVQRFDYFRLFRVKTPFEKKY